MRRMALTAAFLAAAVIGLAPVARAHEGEHEGGPGGGWHAKAAKALDLTDDQQAKMKAIGEDQRKTMQPLWEQIKLQLDELRVLVDKKASDGELTAKLNQIKATRDKLEAARHSFQEKKAAVLTPTQQAKVAIWMGEQAGQRMGRMMRWHEGHEGGEHHMAPPPGGPGPQGQAPHQGDDDDDD